MFKVNWPHVAELGQGSVSGVFCGPCSYFLFRWNPVRAPPSPHQEPKASRKNHQTNICILAQRPCDLASLPPASTCSLIGSPSFTFWPSFLILCSLDGAPLFYPLASRMLEGTCPSLEDTPSYQGKRLDPCGVVQAVDQLGHTQPRAPVPALSPTGRRNPTLHTFRNLEINPIQ
uniref:Uncharacterized protein n=1 Tax=Molossus molossus TaxID=27622 RepID=A0A7J8JWA2_MOLMO|nr:hypothetical protein HJG59_008029 [Molossus molossus]